MYVCMYDKQQLGTYTNLIIDIVGVAVGFGAEVSFPLL